MASPSANHALRFGIDEHPLTPALAKRLPPLPTVALWLIGHAALRGVPRTRAVWEFLIEEAAGLAIQHV